MSVTFVFKCPRGPRAEKPEAEAESFNGTACEVCYGPMLVSGVKTR